MNVAEPLQDNAQSVYGALTAEDFSRIDESNDALFYAVDRFVHHLDATALSTVEALIGDLVVEERPAILDLMASWNSHIPGRLRPSRMAGLGLNAHELARNPALTEHVIHDLNAHPALPFEDGSFDVAINTVSVDYMTRPFEIFREVGRILKPNGLFLVIFSNRMFPEKATKVWHEATEDERVNLVLEFFRACEAFGTSRTFVSCGLPRPGDDRYAHLGIPSDPVYAVYAEKKGPESGRKQRPEPKAPEMESPPATVSPEKRTEGKKAPSCPHCGERMKKWAVPNSPFSNWDTEFMYICFNDRCPYFVRGWEIMRRQGNPGTSYRYMCDETGRRGMPFPVGNANALKGGIVD